MLYLSGDIELHPGPSNNSTSTSDSRIGDMASCSTLNNNLFSFIHYNVQSIANKMSIIETELPDFDILAFTVNTLLFGNSSLGDIENNHIFEIVQNYIMLSKRFEL